MNQFAFHNNTLSRETPAVLLKEKESYSYWLILYRNFPKTERFGIGQKINYLFIEVLELSFNASYLPAEPKIIILGKTISKLDILKFFTQLAWENKLIPSDKYINLSKNFEEIGRMLGGWKKGLQSKTPAK